MPLVPFGVSAYRRDQGNMPELRVVNMLAERSPTAQGQVTLMSREGLSEQTSIGTGPIRAIFQEPGTFGGDRFIVSGTRAYRGTTLLGSIIGTGPVSVASSGVELVFAAGGEAVSYDGDDLQSIDFPDGLNVLAVAYLSERFIFVPETPLVGAGGYYFSALGDGRTVGGSSFINAESAPDGLVDVQVLRGNAYLVGNKTIEIHRTTGSSELPYALIQQSIASKGAIATGCTVEADNSLVWIGHDGILYRWGEVPQQLSDPGLEERIIASSTRRLLKYDYQGHTLALVVLDDDVFAFDVSTGQIHNPRSYGLNRFRAASATNIGTAAYLGDESSGQIWEFSGFADDEGPLERLFTAFSPISAGNVAVDNLWIEANVGRTDLLAGQGSNPQVEMRFSRDAGATWSAWDPADLGEQGQYRTIVEWRALGTFDVPGAMFEFRVTDPVGFRASGVHINDPTPGRSR